MSDYLHPKARVVIFSKAPLPGLCNTRLIPHLGVRGAARLQRRLLEKSLDTVASSGLAQTELWCAPHCNHTIFQQARLHRGLALKKQPRGDLGTRMGHALRRSLRRARYVLIVGTDCPSLTADYVKHALDALAAGSEVVIGPARDGGYVLIGARRNLPGVFRGIPWSTSGVMPATRRRLSRIGASYTEFAPLWDVDRPEDLRRARSQGLL